MYERHTEPLLPWRQFLCRLARHGEIALAALLVSLALGTLGFHWSGPQDWLDAFLNAAMLLGGMGPVGSFEQPIGKVFAGLFALYAGIVFLGASVVLLAPIVHRILHKLHLEEQDKLKAKPRSRQRKKV
jgi:hypothetical protein